MDKLKPHAKIIAIIATLVAIPAIIAIFKDRYDIVGYCIFLELILWLIQKGIDGYLRNK